MSRDALNPTQFRFAQANPRGAEAADKYHHLYSIGLSSSMLWHHKTGEIGNIAVPEDLQRRGIATAMWHEAHRIAGETRGVKPPRHSPDRTDAGDAWARSVSKRLPKRREMLA